MLIRVSVRIVIRMVRLIIGLVRTEKDRSRQSRIGQDRTGPVRTLQERSGHVREG